MVKNNLINKLKLLSLKCFFNDLSELSTLNEFAYNKLIDVCKEQNIYFFEVPDNIINKDITDDKKKSSGQYIYLKGKTTIQMNQGTDKILSISKVLNKNVEIDDYFPRILINIEDEISKNYKLTVLAHELGHHFINIRNEEQSEDLADKYIYDIFLVYLPDFFVAIYNVMIKVKSLKIKYDLDIDYNEMYRKYLIFRDQHPEMNLPLYKND